MLLEANRLGARPDRQRRDATVPPRKMRAPPAAIPAPPFPSGLPWINVAPLRMDKQRGRPVLVEFWDFCRVNSLRTLPYLKAWHERYAERGLRVIGVHTGGFACSRELEAVQAAVQRLEIPYPVVVDSALELWDLYGNEGWPARYLWDPSGALFSMHYGEGAYAETEREIGELLGIEVDPVAPLRPEDAEGARLARQTPDQRGAYSGPYAAAGVHVVCSGRGTLRVDGAEVAIDGCDVYTVIEHARHTEGTVTIEPGPGVEALATCFTPGLP
jgi:hypothetical protein